MAGGFFWCSSGNPKTPVGPGLFAEEALGTHTGTRLLLGTLLLAVGIFERLAEWVAPLSCARRGVYLYVHPVHTLENG